MSDYITLLDNVIVSTESPNTLLTIKYAYERDGANMKYKIYCYATLGSSGSFRADSAGLHIKIDGTDMYYNETWKPHKYTSQSRSGTGWPVSFEQTFTINNKTTGNASLYVHFWDTQGSSAGLNKTLISGSEYATGKVFPYLTVTPARSDVTQASCDSSGVLTVKASRYSGDFTDTWTIKDTNNLRTLLTWNYSSNTTGEYTQTKQLPKDVIAYIASMQNTASPSFKVTLESFSGGTSLGSTTMNFNAIVSKSSCAFTSIYLDMNNSKERLNFYTNISSYTSSNITNRLSLYATDASNNQRYLIYQGNVTNNTLYTVTADASMQALFDYAGNSNNIYLYATVDSYASGGNSTPSLGQSVSGLITKALPQQSITGTSSIEELNTTLNTYKASGKGNLVFIKNLSNIKYTMSAYMTGDSSKTNIYGQAIRFYSNNSLINSPYEINNVTSLPTLKAATNRSIVTPSDITPSGTTLLDYARPSLTYNIIRSDSQGNVSQTGNSFKLTAQAVYTDLSSYTTELDTSELKTAKVTWSITDGTTTASGEVTSSLNNINIITSGPSGSSGFNYKKSAILTIDFVDQLNQSINTITYTIPPGRPGMYGYKTSNGDNHTYINDECNVDGILNVDDYGILTNGIISQPNTGHAADTPLGNSKLVIKRVASGEAPNNGVVLEYGNSSAWTGQLFIGDNATQGIYYNGWSNGVRGSWKRLAVENELLDKIYPVGSIYISVNNTDPGTTIGGTWQQLSGGYLYADSSGTGGDSLGSTTSGSTALTIDQMPSHTHVQDAHEHVGFYWVGHQAIALSTMNGDTSGSYTLSYASGKTVKPSNMYVGKTTATNQNTGGGQGHTHSIAPKGIRVFMWKRTA